MAIFTKEKGAAAAQQTSGRRPEKFGAISVPSYLHSLLYSAIILSVQQLGAGSRAVQVN